MSRTITNLKLGILAVVVTVSLVSFGLILGIRGFHHETVTYHTYFEESVQGLEVAAPVKYRGVLVGRVGTISIAQDHAQVDVTLVLDAATTAQLDLGPTSGMRARLGTQGVTGIKYLDLDVPPSAPPLPRLGFAPDPNYIPSQPSLFKNIEDRFGSVGEALPDLLARATSSLERIDRLLADVTTERLPQRLGAAIDEITRAATEARTVLRDTGRLPDRVAATLGNADKALAQIDRTVSRAGPTFDNLDRALARLDGAVARLGGDTGAIASFKRAADSIDGAGRGAIGNTRQLDRTLRDLDDAARAIRELVDTIQRDPDMLLKGRGKRTNP